MSKCEHCGRDVLFPFGCCYCQRAFCSEHVPSTKHECQHALGHWHNKRKATERELPSPRRLVSPITAFCTILILSIIITTNTSCYLDRRELVNPTYQEALRFIESDQTDKNVYREAKYTCANFAEDFKSNALEAGYKCGYVLVFFPDLSHALNCFNTTDCGLTFIEPQEDAIVTVTIGQPYWDRTKYASNYFGDPFNDTVINFLIDW